MYMSCLPYVMYDVVVGVNVAIALSVWLTDLNLYVFFESTISIKPSGWFRFCCEICDGSLSHL